MKKALALLLILGAVVGSLSAQNFKFNGYINSGLGLILSTEENTDPKLAAFANDAGQWNYRLRLDGSYANEDNNLGVNVRIEGQGALAFRLPYAYGWFKAADIVTAYAGLVDNGTFNSGGAILNTDAGEGVGALAVLNPLNGLYLGVGAYVGSWDKISNNVGQLEPEQARYTSSLAFQLPQIFKVTAVYRTKTYYTDAITEAEIGTYGTAADNTSKAIFGLQLLPLAALKAVVEVEGIVLDEFKDKGALNIYETVSYDFDELDVGINAIQYYSQVKDDDKLALRFTPWVSYTIGDFVPRLDVGYVLGAGLLDTAATVGKYHRATPYTPTYTYDDSVITIRPSLKYNLNSVTFVELGYVFNLVKKADSDYDTHTVYLDFKWSF